MFIIRFCFYKLFTPEVGAKAPAFIRFSHHGLKPVVNYSVLLILSFLRS
jgi:hypothetical protein